MAKVAHKRFVQAYGVPFNKMSSTWFYRYYNLSTLTVGSALYYKFFMDLQKTIRKTVNHKKPLWYQCWLNFHTEDEVLDWHNHTGCLLHGFVSIDPKNTTTQFKDYTIKNKPGKMYIGKPKLYHRVNVLTPYKGERITIAFDVVDVKNMDQVVKRHGEKINTGFIPCP